MATKLVRMVTYHKRLLRKKLRNSLVTWSCLIKWQAKTIMSLLIYLYIISLTLSLIHVLKTGTPATIPQSVIGI